MTENTTLLELVQSCTDISDIDQRVELLELINRLLPIKSRIKLPTFITNDYIDKTLDLFEERFEFKRQVESRCNLKRTSNAT